MQEKQEYIVNEKIVDGKFCVTRTAFCDLDNGIRALGTRYYFVDGKPVEYWEEDTSTGKLSVIEIPSARMNFSMDDIRAARAAMEKAKKW